MLIYNHKREFTGMDKSDLDALGYADLGQLLQESADFADLFVKSPGYIHNFKHVHWIDFIACAESQEDSKVIINAKGKNYKAVITIEAFYLSAAPTKKSYLIKLNNLRALTQQENEQISGDLLARPLKKTPLSAVSIDDEAEEEETYNHFEQPEKKPTPQVIEPIIEEPKYKESPNVMHDAYDDVYEDVIVQEEPQYEAPIIAKEERIDLSYAEDDFTTEQTTPDLAIEEDFKLDLEGLEDEPPVTIQSEPAPVSVSKPKATVTNAIDSDFDNSYVYDPKVASEELGLPIDLIEEFIQDFIAQAHEFKEPLYKSLDENDIDNIKVLSHKLKGVAANLRITDAFDVLVTINTSNDISVISLNLNRFYKIIAKLSGEPLEEANEPLSATTEPEENNTVESEIDEDTLTVIDEPLDLEINVKETTNDLKVTSNMADDIGEDDLYMDSFEPQDVLPNDLDIDPKDSLKFSDSTSDIDFKDNLELEDSTADLDFKDDFKDDLELEDSTADLDFKDDFATPDLNEDARKSKTIAYNKYSIANEIGIDQESFNELFNNYLEESQRLLKTLHSAVVNSDVQMWKKIAMNLKGMSDNMRLSEISKDLEAIISTEDAQTVEKNIGLISNKLTMISSLED